MTDKLKKIITYRKRLAVLLLLSGVLFAIPTIALSWPTNHLDSSPTGNKPYCISCHSYKTGYVSLEKINGNTPLSATVSTNRNASFTMDFRTVGLGYGRFTVAGAVQVPDTTKWYLSTKTGGDVPWFVATQSTTWGAPENSPYMWSTAFSENSNPNGQKGVTLDDGTKPPAPFVDRNETAHDEPFTVKVFVYDSVPYGTYYLKLWGIGTASNGSLGYNEKVVTVNVYNDTTPPTAPTYQAFDGITTSTINVKWNASSDGESGMNGYEIYRGTSSSGPFEYVGYAYYPATSYTDKELLAGTTYYYKINAVDNAGNITWASGTGNATTSSGARTDSAAPATPAALSAFLITNPQDATKRIVKLTWNANTEGDVVGYYVYRATAAAGPYAALNQTVVNSVYPYTLNQTQNIVLNSVYYTDTQVRYGTTYYYKVMALDVAGKLSEMSSYVAATPVVDVGDPNPHGNYRSKNGMCQNCHSIHTASGQELIYKSSITDSCYTCHDGSQSKYNTKAAFDPVQFPSHHKIPEGRYSCDVCHNPHYDGTNPNYPRLLSAVSKEDGQIKNKGNEFCWACHGVNSDLPNPFGKDHQTAFITSKHNSLTPSSQATGIVCRNCHVPHGSRDYPLMVSANSANFCISCHKNSGYGQTKVYKDDNSVLAGVYLNNFSNNYLGTRHEENFYGRNTCTMCHVPHGSQINRYMMKYPYKDFWTTTTVNGKVYGPINYTNNAEANMMCFRCHDSQYYVGINGDYTRMTVGSRFGGGNAKNYHNHTSKWKISCRACHDPHSGKSAFHDENKPGGDAYDWNLNNNHYVNFDWSKQVGIATYSSQNNRLAFIPAYGVNNEITGYSCAIKCHSFDHSVGGGNYKSYVRTSNSPALKCAACHDFDTFDTNSRHPVLGPISTNGNTINCEQCHLADHTLHNQTNPYGLQDTIVTNWVYDGAPKQITTTLPRTYDPVTGEEIPAYKEFCWQCHGPTPGRNILGDKKTAFVDKPHSILERSGTDNPYGIGMDMPCLTCHYHHSSSNIRLLRKNIDGVGIDAASNTGKINACMACHDGSPAPVDISSKYNAASSAGHFIKADPTKKLLCTECHDSHGTSNKKYLLDTSNKYKTGITFEGGRTGAGSRWFCVACHPLYGESPKVYNTVYTVGAGQVTIQPLPGTVEDHKSTGTRECAICHDPHKPWPATGGEDKCYSCHSRPNGEATDIKRLMGLTTQPGTGLLSKHPISDADTINNTCMANCHTAHPHAIRADHLKTVNEKTLCLGCHDKTVTPAKSPYTIDAAKYDINPHNYNKVIRSYPADDSTFIGNCDKCHVPHGSDFKPLLRNRKDELCVGCHNGVETDGYGNVIKDIKTLYNTAGHRYTNFTTAKMYCDECHIPHGSTNDNYLRDSEGYAPRQSMTYVGGVVYSVYFPDNLIGANYKTRVFCTTCHREYVADGVYSWVYYKSETTPGGQVNIRNIPLIGDNGIQIDDHKAGMTKNCTECHNPHDPEPVGNDAQCFLCHGANGYATRIEPLTGLQVNGTQIWPADTVAKASYHPIKDVNTAVYNDCMNMCHTKHVHNPRANLIKDKRPTASDVTAPAAPIGLNPVPSSANQVDLQIYAPPSTDVVGYYVYRSTDNVVWNQYAVVYSRVYAPATLWFYDGGLMNGMTVYYKAQAFDRKGNISVFTNVYSATTSLAADKTKPDIPLNVKANLSSRTEMKSTSIVLSWSPSKDNYEMRKYNIYRAIANPDNPASYTPIGSTGVTSFTDGSLAENTTYYYRVTAVDSVGNESERSAWVSAATNRAFNDVTAGSAYYRDGASVITMDITRPEDTSQTPTNIFMNGANMKIKVTTPPGYFGTGAPTTNTAQITQYPNSTIDEIVLGAAYKEGFVSNDTFTWNVTAPGKGSLWQLKINLAGNGKTLSNKEIIYVVPTTRFMKTFRTPARAPADETLVFKPGDTIYAVAPTEYPIGTFSSDYAAIYDFKGVQLAQTLSALDNGTYDTTNGHVYFQFTLPSTGLVNDNWYYFGAYGKNTGKRIVPIIDIFQQILIRSPDTTAPNAPTGLNVAGSDQNKVSLSWTASSSTDVVGYTVYRKKSTEGTYVLAGTTAPDTLNYDVTGLDPGVTYNFKVIAFDASSNDSADSNIVNQATAAEGVDTEAPNAPTGVRMVIKSSSSINVLWNANSVLEKVVAYSVYRSTDDLNYYKVASTSTTSLTDNNLFDNTTYYYKVMAYDKAGNISAYSTRVYNKTKSSGENSIEGALCMSCHDGVSAPPVGYSVYHKIGTAYNQSKHNVDYDVDTFKDGSIYRGNCTKCHVPHGSDYVHLLRQDDDVNLCFICHEPASESGKYSGKAYYQASDHGKTTPVGEYSYTPRYWPGGVGVDSTVYARTYSDAGRCYNCHAPHGRYDPETGQYIKGSAWAGNGTNNNRLCFTCHNDDANRLYGEWRGKTVYSTTYHGNSQYNAKMKLTDALGVSWGAGECANCHDPHGTQYNDMLRYQVNVTGSKMNELCLKCHDKTDVLADTGLFDGSAVYVNSKHGQSAQWLSEFNTAGFVYNKTSFLPGVCLNCHNSHGKTTDNSTNANKVIKKMLVIEDGVNNDICVKCHEYPAIKANQPGFFGSTLYAQSAHKGVSRPGVRWPGGKYYPEAAPVEDRGKCINCHDPHGTAKKDRYGNIINIYGATFDEEEELCYACHKSGVLLPIYDLAQFKGKLNGHMPWMTVNVHTYSEDLNTTPRHVECQDCHNTHVVESTYGVSSLDARLPKVLKGNWGVKITSWPQPKAPRYTDNTVDGWVYNVVYKNLAGYPNQIIGSEDTNFEEYMLCFKCHASYAPNSGGKRVIAYMNPNNVSSHGFNPYSKNPTSFTNPALNRRYSGPAFSETMAAPTYSATGAYYGADYLFKVGTPFNPTAGADGTNRRYKVTCSDCHGNSNPSGPKGPHGSNLDYLLKRDPKQAEFCFDCHYPRAYWTLTSPGFMTNLQTVTFGTAATHGKSNHFATGVFTFYGPGLDAGSEAREAVDRFMVLFGNNYCRYCHFAGAYHSDREWISMHGENGSFMRSGTLFADANNWKAFRGLNGYFIGRITKTSAGSGTCDGDNTTLGYYCKHASGGPQTYTSSAP